MEPPVATRTRGRGGRGARGGRGGRGRGRGARGGRSAGGIDVVIEKQDSTTSQIGSEDMASASSSNLPSGDESS